MWHISWADAWEAPVRNVLGNFLDDNSSTVLRRVTGLWAAPRTGDRVLMGVNVSQKSNKQGGWVPILRLDCDVAVYVLKQCLVYPRVGWNLQSVDKGVPKPLIFLHLPNSGMTGMWYYTWLAVLYSTSSKLRQWNKHRGNMPESFLINDYLAWVCQNKIPVWVVYITEI